MGRNKRNLYKWSFSKNNSVNLGIFEDKFPDRAIISVKRVIKKHKYFTQILSIEEEEITYFINFDIADANGYIQGSLSSPFKIELSDGKKIIKANIPTGYVAENFEENEGKESQKDVLLIVMREDDEIYNEVIDV